MGVRKRGNDLSVERQASKQGQHPRSKVPGRGRDGSRGGRLVACRGVLKGVKITEPGFSGR